MKRAFIILVRGECGYYDLHDESEFIAHIERMKTYNKDMVHLNSRNMEPLFERVIKSNHIGLNKVIERSATTILMEYIEQERLIFNAKSLCPS